MTVVVNALGLPAVTVPVGISEGLPQVVQIIGPPFAEMRCLAAAEALEAQVKPLTPHRSAVMLVVLKANSHQTHN